MNISVLSEEYCNEKKAEWTDLSKNFKKLVKKIEKKHEAEKDLLQTKIKQVLS
jgi:hypothetical protein